MNVTENHVVSIAYTLSNADGEVIDQGSQQEPLEYLHGHGNLVPGVEEALEGQEVGANVSCDVTPEKGYGSYDPELDLIAPLTAFPEDEQDQIQPGTRFRAPHPSKQDELVIYNVVAREDDQVRITGNHPLAGQTLHFDIEVMSVRPATESELEHGHVH